MKELRKKHRNIFTQVVELEDKHNQVTRTRIRNPNYIPFRQWIKSLSEGEFSGKAAKIRGTK